MSNDASDKVETAEAWNEYCDLLKKAGDVILRDELEPTLFDKGEGLRYLGRLVRAGLFSFGENQGPDYPRFGTMPDGVKMGLDNPDNYYLSAGIDPRNEYRITGTRGTIHYMSFAAQNQNFAAKRQASPAEPDISTTTELEDRARRGLRDHRQPGRSTRATGCSMNPGHLPDIAAPDLPATGRQGDAGRT